MSSNRDLVVMALAIAAVMIGASVACATGSASDVLAPELEFLSPLLGPPRVGSYIDSAPGELEMTVQWEAVHGGQVVRFTKSVPEVGFTMESLYYWDRLDERVVFVTVTSRGIMARGDVREEEGGAIVLSGTEVWADSEIEFRLAFTVLPDGTVRDVYERLEERDFVPGHVIEYAPHPG